MIHLVNLRKVSYIPRRDTGSLLNHLTGGRIFSGEHHLAKFHVIEEGDRIDFSMKSRDEKVAVRVQGRASNALPPNSCFSSLDESSTFFECGSLGYSVTRHSCRLDGLRLKTLDWQVRALEVDKVESSFFSDTVYFPAGSAVFDHALIMRNIRHEWHQAADLFTKETA